MTGVAQDAAATVPSAAEAQDGVWVRDPDARVSDVLAPAAETVRLDGGFRVTGRWYYNSGSWHAGWAVLGISITDGEVADQGLALTRGTISGSRFGRGARHAVTLPIVDYEIYGKALLGRDDQITPLI